MSLAESKLQRLTTLCALYVAQGVPWGFVTVTFAAWLAKPEHGITATQLGPILAVATLPWSFKFLWGPVMDRYTIRSVGRRRPWIIFAQSMAILVLSCMALIDDLPKLVWTSSPDHTLLSAWVFRVIPGPLAAVILLANVFVSMQDVAVDALAVDLLSEKERGVANGLMYGSSYLGTAIGGAGLGWVVDHNGIQAGLLTQAGILLTIMLLPICIRERRSDDPSGSSDMRSRDQPLPSAAISTSDTLPQPELSVWRNLIQAFSLRSTFTGLILALSVRIGAGILTAVFVDYLMKDGGWTLQQYSAVTGGLAVSLGLVGAVGGGFIADRIGPRTLIVLTTSAVGFLWIAYGTIPSAIESQTLVTAMLLIQETLLAMMSVALFALFMSISWPRVAATQFTTYMALMNLSTTIGSYLAATLSTSLSIGQILCVSGVLQIAILLPLALINPSQTRTVLGNK